MVSMRQLLVGMTAIGLVLTGLKFPTPLAAAVANSVLLGLIAYHVIRLFVENVSGRLYHVGFLVVCMIYAYVASNESFSRLNTQDMLLTQHLFLMVEPYFVLHDPPLGERGVRIGRGAFGGGRMIDDDASENASDNSVANPRVPAPPPKIYNTYDLMIIWHSTWAIALGEMAGVMNYRRRRRHTPISH